MIYDHGLNRVQWLKGRGKSESRWQNNVLGFDKANGHWKDDGTWGQKQKKTTVIFKLPYI
jgi:hypothetical protein